MPSESRLQRKPPKDFNATTSGRGKKNQRPNGVRAIEGASRSGSPIDALRVLLEALAVAEGAVGAAAATADSPAGKLHLAVSTGPSTDYAAVLNSMQHAIPALGKAMAGPPLVTDAGDVLVTRVLPVHNWGEFAGLAILAYVSGTGKATANPAVTQLVKAMAGPLSALELARVRAVNDGERALLRSLNASLDPSLRADEALEHVAVRLRELVPFDRIRVCSIDRKLKSCTVKFVQGVYVPGLEPGESLLYGSVPDGELEADRVKQVYGSGTQSGGDPQYPGLMREYAAGLSSFIVVPMRYRGEIVGSLTFAATETGVYASQNAQMLLTVADELANFLNATDRLSEAFEQALERELRWRLDAESRELMRIHQERQTFMSLISHELRTPLTTVLGGAEILSTDSQASLTARQKQCIETIRRGANSLARLMEDIFDLTRVQAGTFRINNVDFDMRELIEGQVQGLSALLEQKGQKVDSYMSEGPMEVNADGDRIGQVLANLISNASKYSPAGSRIEVSASAQRGRCYVSVKDFGMGISREDQRRLFTPFFRADNEQTRAQPGTGLGLCIAKTLVELHGGELTVESEIGQGTTVRFFIRGSLRGQE